MDTEIVDRAMSKLSGWQKAWLVWLYEITTHLEEIKHPGYRPCWGVSSRYWRKSTTHGLTSSARASISRTWRRLERRGLLIRQNDITDGHKTTCLLLTDLGREVAKRLTLQQVSEC